MTQLTDDILVAANRSVRKAAAFLSERTGQTVTRDKIQNALRRSGVVMAFVGEETPWYWASFGMEPAAR